MHPPRSDISNHPAAVRLQEKFQRAFALHQHGDFARAKPLYEEILAVQRDHFDALHFLGVLLAQTGDSQAAIGLMNRAMAINPDHAPVHLNRGKALQGLGQLDDALRSYDRAIELQPDDAVAHNNRGNVLAGLNRPGDALQSYDRAIEIQPGYAEPHNNRGNVLLRLRRPGDALKSFDRAVELQPRNALAHSNRGNALRDLSRPGDALRSYDRAIDLQPRNALAHINRGNALRDLGRPNDALQSYGRAIELQPRSDAAHYDRGNVFAEIDRLDDALQSFDRAIALNPGSAEAHINRGLVLADLKRFDDALASFNRAIAARPDCIEAHTNLGNLLADLKRFDDALASYDRAIALKPDYAEGYTGKAELLLLMGDYERGWELYEWRWKSSFRKSKELPAGYPVWSGEQPVAGKTILVLPEVGFGDFMMFARYAPLMTERGANVVLYAPAPLRSLLSTLDGSVSIVEEGSALPHVDLQCPIMSLPRAFGTTIATIPGYVPYLKAAPEMQESWSKRLGKSTKLRVGLMWSGKANRNIDRSPLRRRSLPLRLLAPILGLPFEFHSLQKEIPAGEADDLLKFSQIESHHEALNDFSDTAALIQQMDLVISIDTSVAHLAGALGKRLWVMLPYVSDYRWMADGEKTHWYPTATLFRQPAAGDWEGVIAQVRMRLAAIAG